MAVAQMVVATDSGKLEGAMASSGVRQFLGVPYAAPPVGELRWKAPQPAEAWKGVREAKEFGHHCWQFGKYNDMVFRDAGPSENCLTLNVWTPAGAKPGTLPVMVWIHGGGFNGGGSSEPRQDGQWLAKRGVVVVSLNYRLGMLGFMTSPELAAESGHDASGNYGLLDQTAALAWVQRNIAGFGGDAKNVTVFGESAGGMSVSALMASPLAKGMMAKALGESGAAFWSAGIPVRLRAEAEAHDSALVQKALGTTKIAELRKISAEVLAENKALAPANAFPPCVDGYFLTDTLANIYARKEEAQIPLLAGWNKDEVRGKVTFAKVKPTAASFRAMAEKDFGDNAAEFLRLYPAKTDAEAVQSAGDFASDRFMAFTAWRWLEAHYDHAPTFRYQFDLPAPADKFHRAGSGAFH
ncbi:MAG: carboxylesterase family protein, partial [Bryocella sp.]